MHKLKKISRNIIGISRVTLLLFCLSLIIPFETTNADVLTVTDFTATSYTLGQTGVTYTMTFTAPADDTRYHIGLSSYTAGAGDRTHSFCNADLNSITDDGTDIKGTINFVKDDPGTDGLCGGFTITKSDTPITPIATGSTVVVTVTNVTNPTVAGAYYPDINDFGAYGSSFGGGFSQPFGTPMLKVKVTAPDGSTPVRTYVYVHSSNYSRTISASLQTESNGIAYFFSSDFYGSSDHNANYTIEVSAPGDSDYTAAWNIPSVPLSEGTTADYSEAPNGPIKLTAPQIKGTLTVPADCTTCTANAGDPVPYDVVEIQDSNRNPLNYRMTQADYNGVFRFGHLAAGTYTLTAHAPYDSFGKYNGLVAPTPKEFRVNEDGSVTYNGSTTPPAGSLPVNLGNVEFGLATNTISGKVKDENGTGKSGVTVQANSMGTSMMQSTTAGDGTYTLKVGRGTWQLTPQQDMSSNWIYCGISQWVQFTSDYSSETKDITVRSATGVITGKVVKPDGTAYNNGQVNIFSKDGCGSYAHLDFNTGDFSANVPAGSYTVSVPAQDYGSPAPVTVTVGTGTVSVGTLTLTAKNAAIAGRLWYDGNGNSRYDDGEGLNNITVQAVKMGGSTGSMGGGGELSQTNSHNDGTYSINVTKGTYTLNVMADPGMMNGGYSTTSTNYIYSGSPMQVTITGDNQTSSENNFQLQAADATITGRITNSKTGEPVTGIYGFANAQPPGTSNQAMMGAGMGTQISNGVFTLKVPAGNYNIGVDFPPETSGYTPASTTSVTAVSGSTVSLDVPVSPNDATIRVRFKDQSGNLVTDLASAQILADNGSGGHQMRPYNPTDLTSGFVDLSVSAGVWRIGYFISPSATNYMSEAPSDNKVTAISGQTVTKDITLRAADSTVSGTVYDPDGNPLAGVYISTDNRKASNYTFGPMFANGATTGSDGTYTLNLPAGTYNVSASFPPSAVVNGVTVNYLNPDSKEVTISSSNPATANFTFGRPDATISGNVTLNGSAQSAFISAFSDKGGYTETSSANGSYSLNVTKDDTWYLRAVYETGTSIYNSSIYKVSMGGSSAKTQDLPLSPASFTMPASVSTTFNCANAKKITLSNGTEISIPAGAIQPSSGTCSSTEATSNITISVNATAQMSLQEKSIPIGVGYDITAADSNGNTISDTFNSNVTITIPYTDTQVSDSVGGSVDDSLLGNGYWDTSTTVWRSVDDQVLDSADNKLTISTNHFTLFSVIATTDPSTVTSTSISSSANSSPGPSASSPEVYANKGATLNKDNLTVIVEENTLSQDSVLSYSITPKKNPLHFGNYWQVSGVYDLSFKSFTNGDGITPAKSSILALRYKKDELDILPENSLKLAVTLDGGKTWKILSNSVLDKNNNTVAAVTKVGGSYMLVAGFVPNGAADTYSTETPQTPPQRQLRKTATHSSVSNAPGKPAPATPVVKETSKTKQVNSPSLWQNIINFIFRK